MSSNLRVVVLSLVFAFSVAFMAAVFPLPVLADDYTEEYPESPPVASEEEPAAVEEEPVEVFEYTDPLLEGASDTDTGTEVIVPGPGDITDPDDGGDLASDNHVTIGGLDFGGFQIDLNLGDLGGTDIIEVASSIALPAAEGLKASLETVFGPYTPRMETVTYYGSDGANYTVTRQVSGIAGVDIEWIATVILYGICLYCFFRILGMVIQRC